MDTWRALISACAEGQQYEAALQLLQEMRGEGLDTGPLWREARSMGIPANVQVLGVNCH